MFNDIENIENIPLSYVELKILYLKANDIKEKKGNKLNITPQMISNWLKENNYELKAKRYYNNINGKMMKYYKISKLEE